MDHQALINDICRALGVAPGPDAHHEVLAEARRLKALQDGMRAGAVVTPGMSPADVATAVQAAQAFAGARSWTPLK